MAVTSTVEFVRTLAESRLVPAEVIERLTAGDESATAAESPKHLARRLVKDGHLTRWQAEQLLSGRKAFFLGKYKLLDRIGSGGMGVVLKAEHSVMGRVVAVKVLGKELVKRPRAGARFRREMQAAAALSHPNIVTAYDADCVGDTYFLVTEYVEGRDLDSWVKQHGPLPVEWACQFAREVALGLGHADERGMVHRDVKPSNLLVTRTSRESAPTVKILDFGLARFTRESEQVGELTHTGQVMGTPDFIAPEQALNTKQADIRADIFSLGCTLYFLLTGRLPFPGDNMVERIAARLQGEAPPAGTHCAEVPAALDAVVAKMLAREPGERYQKPYEVAAALAPFCPAHGRSAHAAWSGAAVSPAEGSPGGDVSGHAAASDAALAQFLSNLADRPKATPAQPPGTADPSMHDRALEAMPTDALTATPNWGSPAGETVGEPIPPPLGASPPATNDTEALRSGFALPVGAKPSRSEPPPFPAYPAAQPSAAGEATSAIGSPTAASNPVVRRARGSRRVLLVGAVCALLVGGLFFWRPWESGETVAEAPPEGHSEEGGESEDGPHAQDADDEGSGQDSTAPNPDEQEEEPEDGQEAADPRLLRLGEAVTGDLSPEDPALRGINDTRTYYDEWTLEAAAGEAYRITLTSSDFDTYLYLFDGLGRLLDRNDDGPGLGVDSQLVYEAERTGRLHVRASSLAPERFGSYQVLVELAEPIDPSDYPSIAVGAQIAGSLQPNDDRFDDRFADRFVIEPHAGETYIITMQADFDTRLYVLDTFGRELASNDDAGGDLGMNSQLVYSFAEPGPYVVIASSFVRGAGGEYHLGVKRAERPDSGDLDQLPRIVTGRVLRASLGGNDAQMDDGSYFDLYELQVQAGRTYTITAQSDDFDTLLFLFDSGADETLDVNDDYPDMGLDSRIIYEATSDAPLLVAVTSVTTVRPSTTGAYTLEVQEQ